MILKKLINSAANFTEKNPINNIIKSITLYLLKFIYFTVVFNFKKLIITNFYSWKMIMQPDTII